VAIECHARPMRELKEEAAPLKSRVAGVASDQVSADRHPPLQS
jgi:hypothetical protein